MGAQSKRRSILPVEPSASTCMAGGEGTGTVQKGSMHLHAEEGGPRTTWSRVQKWLPWGETRYYGDDGTI